MPCRENEQLSKYGDTKTARNIMLVELKKLIEANPLFRDKLQFPSLKNSRLRTLINQRCSRSDSEPHFKERLKPRSREQKVCLTALFLRLCS